MNSFFKSISNSPIFTFLGGAASIVGLIISYNNDRVYYWFIFTFITLIFLQLLYLININNKMLVHSDKILKQKDLLNFYVFDSKVDLEEKKDGSYASNADIFLVLHPSLTPDALMKEPVAKMQIQFPSQLKMNFYYQNNLIQQIENTNNTCSFQIPLNSEVEFLAIRSIHLKDGEKSAFEASSKKIDISVECSILEQQVPSKSIPINNVGW
ncbi:hypothetical protein LCM26_16945 [Bacillus stratosphericus]|nr:hypothetical protein [Bacillus stratosphericus]